MTLSLPLKVCLTANAPIFTISIIAKADERRNIKYSSQKTLENYLTGEEKAIKREFHAALLMFREDSLETYLLA